MKTGITGGIGSGKSYVCQRLIARGLQVYDCDEAAKRLIRTSPEIHTALTRLLGPDAYIDGQLNKALVARYLLASESHARAIDAIVHPAVFRDFEQSGLQWMESAIMYESGIYRLVDRVVVVTAPEEVRIRRVMQRDGISREKVAEWMQRQWSQDQVRQRADYEIVNDGICDIDAQLDRLLAMPPQSPSTEKNRWAKSLLTFFFLLLSTLGTWAQTGTQALVQWQAGHAVTQQEAEAYGLDRCFSAQPLSETVFARMQGHSYPADCTVSRDELRYIRTLHWHHDGTLLIGELVCNRAIADDLVDIFRTLYRHHYPIERMQLIDDYGADDERSMRANNTSCFCFRRINGSKRLSKHARGMAIDINPLYNPYVKRRQDGTYFLQPATATPYRDRTQSFRYKIDTRDLCYRLFIQHGFRWGGAWKSHQDYQHFEK